MMLSSLFGYTLRIVGWFERIIGQNFKNRIMGESLEIICQGLLTLTLPPCVAPSYPHPHTPFMCCSFIPSPVTLTLPPWLLPHTLTRHPHTPSVCCSLIPSPIPPHSLHVLLPHTLTRHRHTHSLCFLPLTLTIPHVLAPSQPHCHTPSSPLHPHPPTPSCLLPHIPTCHCHTHSLTLIFCVHSLAPSRSLPVCSLTPSRAHTPTRHRHTHCLCLLPCTLTLTLPVFSLAHSPSHSLRFLCCTLTLLPCVCSFTASHFLSVAPSYIIPSL